MTARLLVGDCREVLATMAANSIDACVTDPPYGLEFMGKEWDRLTDGVNGSAAMKPKGRHIEDRGGKWQPGSAFGAPKKNPRCRQCGRLKFDHEPRRCFCELPDWDTRTAEYAKEMQAWHETWAREVYRVLKPGAHMLAFGGTRTHHRLMCAIEDAGFEIRDCLMYIYGSGFPKSLSVGKATQNAVQLRYGTAQCVCLDTGERGDVGDDPRHGIRAEIRSVGQRSGQTTEVVGDTLISVNTCADANALCDVRDGDLSQASGYEEITTSVLFKGVRELGSEEAGYRPAEIWPRLEESTGESSAARSNVPSMSEDTETERAGAPCPSLEAVPIRRNEQPDELSGTLRELPSSNRSNDESGARLDSDRCFPRQVIPDNFGGKQGPVVRVCSWCGLPDQDWIDSLTPLGTALKPAYEPIILARKPLTGSVAANVTAWGVGGLHIAGCRIAHTSAADLAESEGKNQHTRYANPGSNRDSYSGDYPPRTDYYGSLGRWPANLILDAESARLLDELSGERAGGGNSDGLGRRTNKPGESFQGNLYELGLKHQPGSPNYSDSGGASRFFYTAKASRAERTQGGASGKHPTQKPIDLMQWLCRLICPPNGTILDPFCGSGTTGVAADREGFHSILIEQDAGYAEDARRKIIGDAPLFAEVTP